MTWFFDGIGTFLVGLVLGGGGGFVLRSWQLNSVKQRQKARSSSTQTQVAGNQVIQRDRQS